jgi:hypothetical protein
MNETHCDQISDMISEGNLTIKQPLKHNDFFLSALILTIPFLPSVFKLCNLWCLFSTLIALLLLLFFFNWNPCCVRLMITSLSYVNFSHVNFLFIYFHFKMVVRPKHVSDNLNKIVKKYWNRDVLHGNPSTCSLCYSEDCFRKTA